MGFEMVIVQKFIDLVFDFDGVVEFLYFECMVFKVKWIFVMFVGDGKIVNFKFIFDE